MSGCLLYELWIVPAGAPAPERRFTYQYPLKDSSDWNRRVNRSVVGRNAEHVAAERWSKSAYAYRGMTPPERIFLSPRALGALPSLLIRADPVVLLVCVLMV